MAGFAVFERQTHWLDAHLTPIAARFNPLDPSVVELHANPMRSGDDGWKRFQPSDRVLANVDALHLLSSSQLSLKVFGCIIDKSSLSETENCVSIAFEKIAIQFDGYLAAQYRAKNTQRGLVIFDKDKYEKHVQSLSHAFKHDGHTDGVLRNFAEVPLFIDSRASRLTQMADLIAYWTFRYYQIGDDRGFKMIEPYFHTYGGQKHRLIERFASSYVVPVPPENVTNYPFPPPSGLGTILPSATPRPLVWPW